MDAAVLIPAQQKEKLSRGFSYAFGAWEVSESLVEFPHLTHCRLWFSNRTMYWHSKWQSILRKGSELEISRCEPAFDADTWDVRLYAVPSNKRPAARQAFEARALPPLTAWATKGRIHRFSVFFNLIGDDVRVESHFE